MSAKNLWGEIPSTGEITTPTQILKEQAMQLTRMTKGTLQGKVNVRQISGKFELQLYIQVPMLDNYEYVVLYATHTLDMYPVVVAPGYDQYTTKLQKTCRGTDEFEEAVGSILSSDQIRRVVASLIAQSRAM